MTRKVTAWGIWKKLKNHPEVIDTIRYRRRRAGARRRGNCYVASEALYHCFAKALGFKPYVMHWRDDTHWFLARRVRATTGDELFNFEVLDPSVQQFKKAGRPEGVDYYRLGRCCGFLTKRPSKRARELMNRLTWSDHAPAKSV